MMPEQPIAIRERHLLLVEGVGEQRFWQALLSARGRTRIQVLAYGGKYNLRNALPAFVRAPQFGSITWLGIAQDADDNPDASLRRVQDALAAVSLPAPGRAWEATTSNPTVMALVMPDGVSPGDLESVIWAALEEQPAASCVDAYLRCLEAAGIALQRRTKTRVHAYLASTERPDRRLAEAAEANILPLSHSVFDRLLQVLPEDSA